MERLTAHEDFDGWFVENEFGEQEYGGFATKQEALDWIKKQED